MIFRYSFNTIGAIFCMLYTSYTVTFDITDWLPTSWVARQHEETSYTYPLETTTQQIVIMYDRGSIVLETWGQHKVNVHMIGHARTIEALKQIQITTSSIEPIFTITLEQPDQQTTIDLKVIVPQNAHVTMMCKEHGNIASTHAPQHLVVSTVQGSIDIHSQQGATINSCTEYGNINIRCETFGDQSSILARAPQGTITLHMPSVLDAEIEAKTQKGSIDILYQLTMEYLFFPKFDKEHIKKMSKHVQGTVGHGGQKISLYASHNIIVQPEQE